MPRKSRPYVPECPWQTTPAQEAGTSTRPVKGADGRKIMRRTRFATHVIMGMAEDENGRAKPVELTARQRDAAARLFAAWSETQRAPAKTGVFVDVTPDWTEIIVNQVIRAFSLADLTAAIPRHCYGAVMDLIRENRHPGEDLPLARQGLDAVADSLRIR